jgi:hypothetical protein
MLDKGVFDEAEKIAQQAVEEAKGGSMEIVAHAALERVEERKREEKRSLDEVREAKLRRQMDHAGNLLESRNWAGALEEYRKIYEEEPTERDRIRSVLEARFLAVAEQLDDDLHEATAKEPPPKTAQSLADVQNEFSELDRLYPTSRRKRLEDLAAALEKPILPDEPNEKLRERLQTTCLSLFQAHQRADKRMAELRRRLDDDRLKEELNPTFVAARKAEEEHRFADALRCYKSWPPSTAETAI